MRKTYKIVPANSCQNLTSCLVKQISVGVMVRLQPFGLEHSPERFGDIKVWAIGGQKEKMKSPFLPYLSSLSHDTLAMNGSIIQYDHRGFCHGLGEVIKKISEHLPGYGILGFESIIPAIRRYHAKKIEAMLIAGRHEDFLVLKVPAVRYISTGTDMALVSETKVYNASVPEFYKLLQLKLLEFKQLRRGYSPWAFSYPLISCVHKSKKRLKVISLTLLPELFSHSALAVFILVRCFLTASLTASVSEISISGRVPRPPFSRSPSRPASRYRLNQSYIASGPYPTNSEISETRFLSAFINTALQRIRKRWHDPKRYAFSSAERSSGLNTISFVFPIVFFSLFCSTLGVLQKSYHIIELT